MNRLQRICTAVFLFQSLAAGAALAVPRYAALYEQNCLLCHVNPTGGGQRSLYAAQLLVPSEMSARRLTPEQMEGIDPQIGKNLTVGCDLRTIAHLNDQKEAGYDNFLQMEGSVYLTFQMNERLLAHVTEGMYGASEVYGAATVLPFNGYIKAGKFTPPFGWRFADHTMFVRQKPLQRASGAGELPGGGASDLGLNGAPSPSIDVGMEAGFFPERLSLSCALMNGNAGSTFDNDRHPALAGRAIYRLDLAGIGLGLGGSIWRNGETFGIRRAGGPFGYAKWRKLVWLGELDWSHLEIGRAYREELPFTAVTNRTISQELSWIVRRGLTLTGTYNLYDPDVDLPSGTRAKYGFGIEYMPVPFLVLHGVVETHRFRTGEAVAGEEFTQTGIQAHLLY